MEKTTEKKATTKGLRLDGLIEETKKMHEENKGSPKIYHESSLKAPTRVNKQDRPDFDLSNWHEYRVTGKCPERRAYQASFVYDDYLYIHGGHDIREGSQDSMWKININLKSFEWEKVQTRGLQKPGKIAYHTLTLHSGFKCLLVGGSNMGEDNSNTYELDLHTLEWKLLRDVKPAELKSIDEHSACLYDNKIYIFGGNCHGNKSNKMFVYKILECKWKTYEFKNGPCARSSHSATVKDGKMFVFGGKDFENNKLSDFWIFDFNKNEWSEIEFTHSAEWPISRSGHSTGVFKNYIIIFGGIHELIHEMCDLHLYDVERKTWSVIYEEDHTPAHNKSNHSSFANSGKQRNILNLILSKFIIFKVQKQNIEKVLNNSDDNVSLSKFNSPTRKSEFSINMKKAKAKHKANMRKSQNFNTSMQKSRLEKLIKKKDAEVEHKNEESFITSPTSLSMKNSFLIKTMGKSFEALFNKKNRKKIDGKTKLTGHKGSFTMDRNDLSFIRQTGKVQGFSVKPRDGHTGIMINDREYVIFGGDRHHMPFNDLAGIDLNKEL